MFPSKNYLRELSQIAVPLGLQMLVFTSSTLIDAIMLGRLGEQELAAVGLADRAMFLVSMLTVGGANAAATLGAQQLGAGDAAGFRRSVSGGVVASGVVGTASALFFWLFPGAVIGLGTSDATVLGLGSDYLRLVGLSMLSAAVVLPLEAGLRCLKQAQIATWCAVVEAGLNILFNYALIFGNFGFPALGVVGAAVGTLSARSVRVLMLLAWVYLPKTELAVGFADLRAAVRGPAWREFNKLATPLTINHLVWGAGVFAFQILYGRMGVTELAAMTVIWSLQRFVLVQLAAISQAGAVLVGRAVGAGDELRARSLARDNLVVALLTSTVLCGLLLLSREPMMGLFSELGGQTLSLVRAAYWLLLLETLLRGVNVSVIVGALKAGGDVKFALYLDLSAAWFVGLPWAAVGAFWFGLPLPAVYALALCEEFAKVILGLMRLRSTRWIHRLAFA